MGHRTDAPAIGMARDKRAMTQGTAAIQPPPGATRVTGFLHSLRYTTASPSSSAGGRMCVQRNLRRIR